MPCHGTRWPFCSAGCGCGCGMWNVECGMWRLLCCNHHIRVNFNGTNKGRAIGVLQWSCSLRTAVGRNSIPHPHRHVRARAGRFQAKTQSHHQPFRYTYVFPCLLLPSMRASSEDVCVWCVQPNAHPCSSSRRGHSQSKSKYAVQKDLRSC
jgi:hypothetical protein